MSGVSCAGEACDEADQPSELKAEAMMSRRRTVLRPSRPWGGTKLSPRVMSPPTPLGDPGAAKRSGGAAPFTSRAPSAAARLPDRARGANPEM